MRAGDRKYRRFGRGLAMAVTVFTAMSSVSTSIASAGVGDSLRSAVAQARGGGCGPLRPDPMIDGVAAKINATTDAWINHTARAVPETDALPLLKDNGYGGDKATILSGAAASDADAIKVTLLQGYNKIPDCAYTAYGVSAIYNAKKGLILTTVVLAA